MSICPNCNQPTFPEDIYCGSCGFTLPGHAPFAPPPPPPSIGGGAFACPTCGYMNEPDSSFCEIDGTPLSRAPIQAPGQVIAQVAPIGPAGILVMPDKSELTLPQTSRVFGRSDLLKYLKAENAKEVSRAHFTITQESGAFYIQDGGADPNTQAWKPSINHTSVNGALLQPGSKQKLNSNDVIDVSQLGLNLVFKTR